MCIPIISYYVLYIYICVCHICNNHNFYSHLPVHLCIISIGHGKVIKEEEKKKKKRWALKSPQTYTHHFLSYSTNNLQDFLKHQMEDKH